MRLLSLLVILIILYSCTTADYSKVNRYDMGNVLVARNLTLINSVSPAQIQYSAYANGNMGISYHSLRGTPNSTIIVKPENRIRILSALQKAKEWGELTIKENVNANKLLIEYKDNPIQAYPTIKAYFISYDNGQKWAVLMSYYLDEFFYTPIALEEFIDKLTVFDEAVIKAQSMKSAETLLK